MFDGRATRRYNPRRDSPPERQYEHFDAQQHTQNRRGYGPPHMRWRLFSG